MTINRILISHPKSKVKYYLCTSTDFSLLHELG